MGLEISLNISFFPPLKRMKWIHILWSLNEFAGKYVNVALQRVLPWHQFKSCMESQKLVPVNCNDSQRGGISQIGTIVIIWRDFSPRPQL